MTKRVAVFCAALIACVALCLSWRPLRYRLYPGDRIKGTLTVSVDGQPCALAEEACRLPENGRFKTDADGKAQISVHGGDYGEYPVSVLLPDGTELRFICFQHNWWNVLTFDLQADVRNGAVRWTGTVFTIADNGQKTTERIKEDQPLQETGSFLIGL